MSAGWGTNKQNVIQVPRLEPKDLYDRRARRDHARLRAYNTLLEQIYHKVYSSSQLPGGSSSVLYSIPPFIMGLPKLDMEDCTVYVVFQLRQAGFEVKFTWPNLLYISWIHHEGEYSRHNPILQAMTPEPPPKPQVQKKKQTLPAPPSMPLYTPPPQQTNIRYVNDEKQVLLAPTTAPQPRRAIDYQPPPSFIQNMERPSASPQKPGGVKGNVLADLWAV
jgi:hypothetical protein